MGSKGTEIKNSAFSCLGSLLVTLGAVVLFGVIFMVFASQMTQAAEREFARKQAAGDVPMGPALNTVEPQEAVLLDDPELQPEVDAGLDEGVDELSEPPLVVSVSLAEATAPKETRRPSRLVIPMLELDAPVKTADMITWQEGAKRYTQWTVPGEFAAGWHGDSAPLGEPGNTVLNGHHNIFGEVFRDLINLPIGEQIILYDGGESFTYEVTNMELLREKGAPLRERLANGRWVQSTDDERLTLITCWPYTGNTHRLVVVAKPVAN